MSFHRFFLDAKSIALIRFYLKYQNLLFDLQPQALEAAISALIVHSENIGIWYVLFEVFKSPESICAIINKLVQHLPPHLHCHSIDSDFQKPIKRHITCQKWDLFRKLESFQVLMGHLRSFWGHLVTWNLKLMSPIESALKKTYKKTYNMPQSEIW